MGIEDIDDPQARVALYGSKQTKQNRISWFVIRIVVAIALPVAFGIWVLLGLVN